MGKNQNSFLHQIGLLLPLLLLVLGLAFAVAHVNFDIRKRANTINPIYWGASINGPATYGSSYVNPPWDCTDSSATSCPTWDLFETHANKKISLIGVGSSWWKCEGSSGCSYKDFTYFNGTSGNGPFDRIYKRGAIPVFSWSSTNGNDTNKAKSDFKLTTISAGNHDAFLHQYAQELAAWHHPVFMRFDWEMNGNWFLWGTASGNTLGNTPSDYVAAWKHVKNVFDCVKDATFDPATASGGCTPANNVTWVWNVNNEFSGSVPIDQLYPGDSYVDWTSIDGYNLGKDPHKADTWKTFSEVFAVTYNHVLQISPAKPIFIAETSSTEYYTTTVNTGYKGPWITDALTTQLPQNFPQVKAFMWFNWAFPETLGTVNWEIESSSGSQQAFATAIQNPYYLSRGQFPLVDNSKILPYQSSVTTSPIPSVIPSPTLTPISSNNPSPSLNPSSTPSPTSIPLTTSNINVTPSNISATISWATSTTSTSQVNYGLSSDSLIWLSAKDTNLVSLHTTTINNLSKNSRYYFKVISQDLKGITVESSVASFRTRNK